MVTYSPNIIDFLYEWVSQKCCVIVYSFMQKISNKPPCGLVLCMVSIYRDGIASSVKYHIANAYNGFSDIMFFADYLAGRKQSFYFPNPIPIYID